MRGKIDIQKNFLEVLREARLTVKQMAEICECSTSKISRQLKQYGLSKTKPSKLIISRDFLKVMQN